MVMKRCEGRLKASFCLAGRGHGFTLIELLVVIAIIAILAAILFPVFAQAREKARQSTCTSNTRNIAMSIAQYVQDYDERVPVNATPCWGFTNPNQVHIWMPYFLRVFAYVKNYQIFDCPSNNLSTGCTNSSIPHFGLNGGWGLYGAALRARFNLPPNFRLGYGYPEGMQLSGVVRDDGSIVCWAATQGRYSHVAKWRFPAEVLISADSTGLIMPSDAGNGTGIIGRVAWANICAANCNPDRRDDKNTRHLGGSLIIFGDGHVKWLRSTRIIFWPRPNYTVRTPGGWDAGVRFCDGYEL
jgi:prepilin-type N-terminal cleavage/methylation domain-containing protein